MSYQRMDQMPDLKGQLYWLAEPQKGLFEALYEHEPDPDPPPRAAAAIPDEPRVGRGRPGGRDVAEGTPGLEQH